MKSITVHGLDDPLDRLIREKADREGVSLNKTIKKLLRDSLGLSRQHKKHDFSAFCGIWSKKEYEEFERSVKDFERIDREDW